MIESDTVKLLRECDAGIKMGIDSIEDVIDKVSNNKMRDCLYGCKKEHDEMKKDIQKLLIEYQDDGKNPNPMAKSMSWFKTNMKMAMDSSDNTIADLMTDGCNMGVKSLSKYLNQYEAADEKSKNLAKRLIKSELDLTDDMRQYL